MCSDAWFYNIFKYLYNKNILEYAQIARSGPKSMIRDIEGLSIKYTRMFPGKWTFGLDCNLTF